MTNAQMFSHQARQFTRLTMAVPWQGDVYGKDRPSPKEVREFAEELLLCPDDDAARTCIARHRAAAELCRGVANDTASACDIESALARVERPAHETPFYLLASVLLRRAELTEQQLDENWKQTK